MPLPEGNQRDNVPWPPLPYLPAFEKMAEWSAWYSGDPDELEGVYQRLDARQTTTGQNLPPSQRGTGLLGFLVRTARRFWGTAPSTGEPRSKLHIPLPADIATVSAELLFSEQVQIKHPDAGTQEILSQQLNDRLHAAFIESAEVCSALGGVYLRAVWNRDVRPEGPWFTPVHADAAIPTWAGGELRDVIFWRVMHDDGNNVVYRHLEMHEKGAIHHQLYMGTLTTLGRVVPLTEFPETAMLVDVIDENGTIPTNTERLTTRYVPNMRPNRLWRDKPAVAPLGRSDYAGCESMFDALDETWSSWMRDIRLAKARIMVPDTYLDGGRPGEGVSFDAEREVFQALKILPGKEGSGGGITLAQFAIRVEEHERTAAALTRDAVTTAGYSQESFNQGGDTVSITATEAKARYRKSLSTRDRKILYWRPGAEDILNVLSDIGRNVFEWKTNPDKPVEVVFPEAIQPDPESVARTLQMLDAAGAISTKLKVQAVNPDHADDKKFVNEEVERIHIERGIGQNVENPDTFRGEKPGQPDRPQQTGNGAKPAEPPVKEDA